MLLLSKFLASVRSLLQYSRLSRTAAYKVGLILFSVFLIANVGISDATYNSGRNLNALSKINQSLQFAKFAQANVQNSSNQPVQVTSSVAKSYPEIKVAAIQPEQNCSFDNSYSVPQTIAASQPGLQTIIDQPSYYTVYGNSVSQIANEISTCTPVTSSGTNGFTAKFAASTANAVSWNVSYNVSNGDMCSVKAASVAIHINQVFPAWQSNSSNAQLQPDWQSFIAQLKNYEQGHVNLDEQGGATLLYDLNNFPTTNCNLIQKLMPKH
jgi:predicted secreted Zn-dependent protease